jgi:Cft2 family RNA processing exonuclease
MFLVPLGETDHIGGTCYYLNVGGTGLLIDAGQNPNDDGPTGLPLFDLLANQASWPVDHVLISHAHHDHVGALPVLLKEQPHVVVHMTGPTRHLLDTLLPASARLQARKARNSVHAPAPTFTENEMQALTFGFRSHAFAIPFDVTGSRGKSTVQATFFSAGHILGAAGVLLEFEEDGRFWRLFCTSDTNARPQTIHPGGEYPDRAVDFLMLECTLGADPEIENTSREEQETLLRDAVVRTLTRGGTVLLPVFALGRAQEVIALVDRWKRQGRIPDSIPLYTSGLMRGISDIYDRTRFISPRLDVDFEVYGVDQKRMPRSKAGKSAVLEEPGIIVASSGFMIERTLSHRIAQRLISDKKNGIFFAGFLKEPSPGFRLLEAARDGRTVILDSTRGPETIECEVDRFRLTGHSNRRDLLDIVGRLQPRTVYLVHGDPEARGWMADNVRFFHPEVEIILPTQGMPLNWPAEL